MKSADLRIRRTYKLLTDALMTLMQEKPIEKITVMEICSQAMVHRATFYKYFEDKYQLLDFCVYEIGEGFIKNDALDAPVRDCREYFLKLLRCLLNEFEAHMDMYIAILKKNKGDYLIRKIQEKITFSMCSKFKTMSSPDISVPHDMLAYFYSGACINVLYWWLENGQGISVDEVVGYAGKITDISAFREV